MRFGIQPDNLFELAAAKLNLAPIPAGEVVFGVAIGRVVMAGVRLGIFARLARSDATAEVLARELALGRDGLDHLLDCLAALGHVERRDHLWSLSWRARRWLDPSSDRYVGDFIEHNFDAWEWWSDLERVVRTGQSFEIHGAGADDPHWRRYMYGQWQLARLSAPEVARALPMPPGARSMIDLAGGHGWFSAELARAHPGLHATVIDLPGSAAIGREIITKAGLRDRVTHVDGDMFESDLGGPHALALVFNIIHHIPPDAIVRLFRRIAGALAPGGRIAVLDLFAREEEEKPDASAFLGLFFYLTSGAATYSPDELRGWLEAAGFGEPRRVPVRRIPLQTLFVAEKR